MDHGRWSCWLLGSMAFILDGHVLRASNAFEGYSIFY